MYKNTAPIARGCGRGWGSRRQPEQGHALGAFGLDDLASLHQLGQQGRSLLAADADRGRDVTAAGVGVGTQELADGVLYALVLALGLGRLVRLGSVALRHLIAQGGQLVLALIGQGHGQDFVQSVNVAVGILHDITLSGF